MKNPQEIANTIKELAKNKKITVGKMLTDCNLSVNTLSSMQAGGYFPRLEAINKIADYLDVSVDYLLGRTDSPESYSTAPKTIEKTTNKLDDTTLQVADNFQELDFLGKAKVMALIAELKQTEKKTG